MRWAKWSTIAAVTFVVVCIVRVASDATALTAAGTIRDAIGLAIPIGMAALGGMCAERAGIINIGLEGQMIMGTWCAGWAGYQWGPWAAVAAAIVGGALFGLLHALMTVTFGVDQIISGVAINIIAAGLARYLSFKLFASEPDGGVNQSPPIDSMRTVSVPGIESLLEPLADKQYFVISDAASVLIGALTRVNVLTIVCLSLVPLLGWLLWQTNLGLRWRSVGENPAAADSLGVAVTKMRYLGVAASGALAGLGGAFLVVVYANRFVEGQTGGRGYIGLAAMIFGNWRPGGIAAGAGLFGYLDALRLRQGGVAAHALLLLGAIAAAVVALWWLRRRLIRPVIIMALFAVGLAWWYADSTTVPRELTAVVPYVATLVVLAVAGGRLRPPAAVGVPYRPSH